MSWLEKFFTSRFTKSISRYALLVLAGYLIQIPLLAPLAEYIKANLGELSVLFGDILLGLVLLWSTAKNLKNAKVEKKVKVVDPREKVR